MSMINKLAKYGAVSPLPMNGGGPGRALNGRLIGPPAQWGPGWGSRGDAGYMMGDPGIFGSIWKGIKGVAGIGTGIVSKLGIPVISGVAGGLSGILSGRAGIPGASTQPIYQMPKAIPAAPLRMPGSGAPTRYGLQLGGTALGVTTGIGAPPAFAGAPPTATMGGFHLNKSSYFLKDGTYIEAGTKWVKNRRRNPGNMRALSRSLSRVKSAKRMAKSLSNVTIRKSCPA